MIDRTWIGQELPESVLPIERTRLQFFAKATGETRAEYLDVAAARAAGYADLPAPPTFLFAAELDSGVSNQTVERFRNSPVEVTARRAKLHLLQTRVCRRHRHREIDDQRRV